MRCLGTAAMAKRLFVNPEGSSQSPRGGLRQRGARDNLHHHSWVWLVTNWASPRCSATVPQLFGSGVGATLGLGVGQRAASAGVRNACHRMVRILYAALAIYTLSRLVWFTGDFLACVAFSHQVVVHHRPVPTLLAISALLWHSCGPYCSGTTANTWKSLRTIQRTVATARVVRLLGCSLVSSNRAQKQVLEVTMFDVGWR